MEFLILKVENFKNFSGLHEFNLRPIKQKPIILFGGNNGSGKSSLFEAIQIALFGRNYFKNLKSIENYKEEIKKRICVIDGKVSKQSRIELTFLYNQNGDTNKYKITRLFELSDSKLVETLSFHKNDTLINYGDENSWKIFINELIPLEVPELFFFDGERFDNIFEDINQNKNVFESFKQLLGINLINKLVEDINYVKEDFILEDGTDTIKNQVDAIKKEIKANEELISNLTMNLAEIYTNILYLENQRNNVNTILNISDDSTERLLILTKSIKEQENLHENLKRSLIEYCKEFLPFFLIPKINENLFNKITEERNLYEDTVSEEKFDDFLHDIDKTLSLPSFWGEINYDESNKEKLKNNFLNVLKNQYELSLQPKDKSIILGLSETEASKVKYQIFQVSRSNYSKINEILEEYNKLDLEINNLKLNLELSQQTLQKQNESYNKMNELIKQINCLKKDYDEKLKEKNILMDRNDLLLKKRSNLINEQFKRSKFGRIQNYIESLDRILKNYSGNLIERKSKEFENSILESYRIISSNANAIKSFKINLEKHEFFINNNKDIDYSKLEPSSGEKHILVLSIIWGLMKMLKWPMPLVIDTPLSRLDSIHKVNLITNFFPNVSHQIILFSTDTEIDNDFFKDLVPFISRSYLLEKDSTKGSTKSSLGYFYNNIEVHDK